MGNLSREAKVGALVLASIAIFAYVWFKVLDLGLTQGFPLKAYFKSVEGLVKDAQVQMAGIKIGKVDDIQYDPDVGKALVTMQIKDAYRNSIPEGSRVALKSKGILGDKYLVVEPGKSNARKLKAGEQLENVFEPVDTDKMLETMGVVAQDLQALTREARRQVVDEKGSQKIDHIMTNTDVVMAQLKDLLQRNHEKINRTMDNTDAAAADISEITSKNKEKINQTVAGMERFSKSMDKTSDKFGRVATELEGLTKDVKTGRGTIGKLVTDDTLFRDAQGLIRDIRGIAGAVRSGPGTISRVLNDPELYFEARRAIRNMNKTAEDVSDQTAISTVANILGAVVK